MNDPATPLPVGDPAESRVRRAEVAASWCLRIGTISSLVLVISGVAVTLGRHPEWLLDPEAFKTLVAQDADFPHSFSEAIDGVLAFRGRAIIQLGILCLIMTPVLRVVVSAIAFARTNDRIFAALALGVLVLLGAAFAAGGLH